MRFILDRIVDFCAIMAGILTYLALRDFPFGIDATLCVGYTVEVLGIAFTDKRAKVFASDPSRPIPKLLLLHVCFLAAVVVIERAWVFLKPMMPQPDPHQARPINWGLLAVIIALFALAYWEERMLFRKSRSTASLTTMETGSPEPLVSPDSTVFMVNGIALEPAVQSIPVSVPAVAAFPVMAVEPEAVAPVVPEAVALDAVMPVAPEAAAPVAAYTPPLATYTVTPRAADVPTPIASAFLSSGAADEHEAFMAYLQSKDRVFRKPGVSVKQEFELWLAHRAKVLKAAAQKKPST
jgi:hypothetical protein